MNAPSANGSNGRDAKGRFAPGWRGGPGGRRALRIDDLRTALIASISNDDIHEIMYELLRKAKGGNVQAIKLLFERVFGPPSAQDHEERLARLSELVGHLISKHHPADSLLFEQFIDELNKANDVA